MNKKWDDLPNEIKELVIQASANEEDVKRNDNKAVQWAMVNKQWYEGYLSVKYKKIFVSSNSIMFMKNIIQSKHQPGKPVRSNQLADSGRHSLHQRSQRQQW